MEETAAGIEGSSQDRILRHPGADAFPSPLLRWVTASLLVVAIGAFLMATPSGVLRKADMVGYAVCHQIGSHSFTLAGRQLPLCARCTGTFLGALVGLFGQAFVLRRGKAAEFPRPSVLVVLTIFVIAWAADGVNSYSALAGGPHLYTPRNSLRLTTGALNGLTVSALVYPVVNMALWRTPRDEPTFRNLADIGVCLLMELLLILVVLSGWDVLLYPVALTSAAGVLTLLTSVNSVIALIALRRENSVDTWSQALWPVAIGLVVSLVQIGAISLVRYSLTGTLEGFALM